LQINAKLSKSHCGTLLKAYWNKNNGKGILEWHVKNKDLES
jgi:hypothetical protein